MSVLPPRNDAVAPLASELGGHDPIDQLFWEKDESFEVPDFHFDWGVARDGSEKSVERGLEAMRLETRLTWGPSTDSSHASDTPPSQGSQSAQSSASSGHVLSLTNTSTLSSRSSVFSPQNDNSSSKHHSPSVHGAAAGNHGRVIQTLNSRKFSRVVSAPLSRSGGREVITNIADVSTGASSLTAILRPTLSHTSSTSSIPGENASEVQRNHLVTPGLTERTIFASNPSTGRRLGGLSRFGGPARRGVQAVDPQLESECESQTPAHNGASPGSDRHAATNQPPNEDYGSPNHPQHGRNKNSSEFDDPSSSTMQSHPVTRELGHQAVKSLISAPPVHRLGTDRVNSDLTSRSSPLQHRILPDHSPRDRVKADRIPPAPPSTAVWDRPSPQPLRPTHIVPRLSPSPPRHQFSSDALKPSRDAPSRPGRTQAQAGVPVLPIPPLQRPPETSAQNNTLPIHSTQPGKRSFIVNGAPYERVGILGKGGSSKVYSVLCPTKRIIYALKRVSLERADAETYQSYTNEIDLLKRLRGHDRIIQLIDHQITFTPGNRPKMLMMVMECGEIDFAMLLDEQRGRRLNTNFVGLYWEQMLEAVHAVHLENVVHTDLKPANFVLVKGRLKIIDFGIAKAIANDTVNIQRDQQIGTVNYMSPEAIQRMNNQKVLKLSYPSDVWSLGCILYQMIYGNPPFASIPGGPLPKMNAIADPGHSIQYPEMATPRAGVSEDGQAVDTNAMAVLVPTTAIDTMRCCLAYRKEQRLTIPELLRHPFLRPEHRDLASIPPDATTITKSQMALLVNFVLRSNRLPVMSEQDRTAEDLFAQLVDQNSV